MIERKMGIGLAIGLFIGIIVGVGGLSLMNRVQPAPILIQPPSPTATAAATNTPAPIRVFVNGQVRSADVYELSPDSIVEAAIEAAGGFTTEADTAVVNLALPLRDGMQIYVPSLAEDKARPVLITGGGENEATATGHTIVDRLSTELVNINTATLQELEALPGIGPSTAQKIIDYRNENGPFTSIDNVMDVSGIGEAKFSQMKELITVGGK